MDPISSSDLVALFAWRATFAEQRDFLISLDGRVGDSDLGLTMVKAFAAAEAVAAAAVGASIGKILITAGVAMATQRLPPWATLTAPGFMRGGMALERASAMGVREVAAFWRGIRQRDRRMGEGEVGGQDHSGCDRPRCHDPRGPGRDPRHLGATLSAAASVAEEALENTRPWWPSTARPRPSGRNPSDTRTPAPPSACS
jgi:phosphoenolpyruvate---glycerone phosphotransferase subunit DhaL